MIGDQSFVDLDALTPEEIERFERILAIQGVELAAVDAIARRRAPAEHPLSFAQRRLWFLAELHPGDPAHNIPMAVRLRGALAIPALAASLEEIARRHEVLRGTFEVVGGEPAQRIAPALPAGLPAVDLAALPAAARDREVHRLSRDERLRPFDLVRGPLLRTTLLALAAHEHVALATFHHLVSDAWSTSVMVRELAALYPALAAGRPSPLPEPALQYADYASWQNERLAGGGLARDLAYWGGRLAAPPPALELPADRPRPARGSLRGGSRALTVPDGVARDLHRLAGTRGATSFILLLAAFAALLHRYTGEEDFVLGAPVAGRGQLETETLIGLFVNTLALRLDLGGDPSFEALLGRVREAVLGAFSHQELPLDRLVEELQPERRTAGSPLFQVTFGVQNAPLGRLALPGLEVGVLEVPVETTGFDLSLVLTETAGRLAGAFTYSADLFDGSTVARLADHFVALLGAVAERPGREVSSLPLLAEAERQALLVEWNDSAPAKPGTASFPQLFLAQAARSPDAVAVRAEAAELTYGELARRAARLGRFLRELGVGAGSPVVLCCGPSPAAVTGMLGIVAAGGAYVPLDPAHPGPRLRAVLEDVLSGLAVRVLLTEEALAGRFAAAPPAGGGLLVVRLDTDWPEIAAAGEGSLDVRLPPDALAYVIYTSGSTGLPKGIAVPHRGLANLWPILAERYAGARGHVFQLTPPSFDASLFHLTLALATGATLCLRPRHELLPGRGLLRRLRELEITVMGLPPSVLSALPSEELPALETLVVGAEACSAELARTWARGRRLVNSYGPSEATICAAESTFQAASGRLPIGRPLAGVRLHVLDLRLRPVPIGVAGELYLGGAGLARGYLGRPDLTAEAFLPDPFGGGPGARLYRTGDLVRRLADGEVEFRGRLGRQVKVRGFRVELGEIESVLRRHEAVREAAVAARDDRAAGGRLVAYVVPCREVAAADLRRFLAGLLPEYMVPSAFVFLAGLPLTAHGKLDHRALPEPAPMVGSEAGGEGDGEPRTWIEEILVGIWAEVLGVARVGVDDDFFALGGHSLLATRAMSRVEEGLGVELSLRALFEHPTPARLGAVVEEARQAGGGAPAPALEPAGRDRRPPLSFAQQRLWFLYQLEPRATIYNIPLAVGLAGALDRAALAASLGEIVRRHEVLRTTFDVEAGEPVQEIAAAGTLELPRVDLAALPAGAREEERRRLARAEAARPFDLVRGPLLRATLAILAPAEHLILLSLHHIVGDGWSMGILIRELGALYRALSAGDPSPLGELPLQYADFALWQRRWLTGEVLEREVAFWRRQLEGSPPVLELPTDRPRPAVQTHAGGRSPATLPAGVAAELRALSSRRGATLFMTLLAAFQALLGRYSGQVDVVLGSPIAGRNRRRTEGLIGFFVNSLVLRADLSGDPGLHELLRRTRAATLAAYDHQDLPFEKLVAELQPERDLSRSPLFQVVFSLENLPVGSLELPGVVLSPLPVEAGAAKFDLTLALAESPAGLGGAFEYNRDLFDAATLARLGEHLGILVQGLLAEPERSYAELPLLAPAERHQLLLEWNDDALPCPLRPMAHEMFSLHARSRPGALAISSPQGSLSYGELEASANRLAHRLRSLGVGPESLVALCTERTVERVVGIVAVLKAGAAYVSLDPAYPRERLAFLLADAAAPVVLTEERFRRVLPESAAAVICLDRDLPALRGPAAAPASGVGPDNLAYVVYTSGSTGKPKGVEIPHAGLSNLVRWHQAYFGLLPADRGTQIASPAFDASIWELWPYLAAGCSVHVPDDDTRLSSAGMIRWWSEQGITVAYLMTPLAEGVLEEPIPPGLPLAVRSLFIGGDRLHHRPAPGVGFRLINTYGPAEYSVVSTAVEVPPAAAGERLPTIGRALDNTSLYLLNRAFEPAPAGVPGELFVAGIGLARGYLRRPEMTAERFLPDPFAAAPGARMYRTGDLVRFTRDGDLEFLGRLDFQVKLRGLRIELGEIETVLGQHPAIRESAVMVREDRPAAKLLVGYLVPVAGALLALDELRDFLKERLPEYMVPAAFVLLEALPLSANGKVDRRALPEPESPAGAAGKVAPRTAIEDLLAGIWSDVLHREPIGIGDSFFELGGHSLLATRVISRIRDTFAVDLPLRKIFEAPILAALAAEIEAARAAGSSRPPRIERAPRGGTLPLSFAQQRLWFMDQLNPGGAVYNDPSAFLLEGCLDLSLLTKVVAEIVRRHEALRTTFARVDGVPVQVIGPPAAFFLPVIDLRGLGADRRPAETRRLAAEEAARPFDLARGPLLRVELVSTEAASCCVLATMHHIASDAWSVGILAAELSALYRAGAEGGPPPLAELPIQYADYAVWQRRWLESEAMAADLAYWRRQLAGLPSLRLPTDRPRPAVFSYRGAAHASLVPPALADALRGIGRRHGATMFMTLLAAFAVLLSRWSGQEDIAVGTDIANRNRAELEGVIGCFVNNLVLRADLAGNPAFGDLLRRVREMTLAAYDHQDLPFDLLVRELRPERTLGHMPLFQVLFVLQNVELAALDLPGLRLSPLDLAADSVKFDLAVFLAESEAGIAIGWRYNPDLFEAATIARMAAHFHQILERIGERPETRIQQLEVISEVKRMEAEQSRISSLRGARNRAAGGAPGNLVEMVAAVEGRRLLLAIQPRARDLDLAGWARTQREVIDGALATHGALLFRGFRVATVAEFEELATAVCPDLYGEYGDLPREREGEKVYHSTPYPADKTILFHNESSHLDRWPLRQLFFCVQAAASGGETPLADCREIYRRLDAATAARFAERKLMYVRNFIPGFDVSWQDFFHTGDRAEVERCCRTAGMDLRWKGDGLEVRQIAPAVARHPRTGELVFFNQIQLHHVATLEPEVRRSLVSVFGEDNLPRTVRYGDGQPIEDSLVERLTELYWECSVALPWQAGDVILLDNMLCAHARNPYSGERKVVVAMGALVRAADVG